MTNQSRLEQGRAAFAYKKALIGTKEYGKDYTSYVKKLPMLIKTNGLGAAIVFFASNKPAHKMICSHILEWSKSDRVRLIVDFSQANTPVELAYKISELDSYEYRAFTIEVLAFLNWLKRFSTGLKED